MKEKSTIALVDDERNILTSLGLALEAPHPVRAPNAPVAARPTVEIGAGHHQRCPRESGILVSGGRQFDERIERRCDLLCGNRRRINQ